MFVLAAVIILPSLALLYVLDQKSVLPEEGVEHGHVSESQQLQAPRSINSL